MNQSDLIKAFLDGATSGEVGNAKIKDDQLIHFSTPILERHDGKIIMNTSMYSDVTRFLQRKINQIIPQEMLICIKKVQWDYDGKLADYLVENKK